MESNKFILWFDEIGISDIPSVGGKNASLGEMYRELSTKGVKVPYGFAVTAEAYRYFLEQGGIREEIEDTLKGLDTGAVANLRERGRKIRTAIVDAGLPEELEDIIVEAYRKLCQHYEEDTDVAIRSSATAEDLPTASFAGQQETYLNIHGESALLLACKRCFASLFTDRAISYRVDKGFDHMKI
ncbi:MAG: PEP/pyruvate-binding domain-containing protein, partial [Deltaproteobacteria bacterium]